MHTQYEKRNGAFLPMGPDQPKSKKITAGVYKVENSMAGLYVRPQPLTHDGLLELPDSPASQVIKDVNDFWERRDAFRALGMAHKRGILLYGPPGTGKTSTISLIARRFVTDGGLVIINDDDLDYTVSMVFRIRQIEPERPVLVVIEDVEDWADDSSLLAFLDGQSSVDGLVVLATTNYRDKLPPRLTERPSRFDRLVEVGFPPVQVREHYLRQRAGKLLSDAQIAKWVSSTEGMAVAHLRELIVAVLCLGNDFDETIERLRKMSPPLPQEAEVPF